MTRPIRQPDLLVTFSLTAFSSARMSKLVLSGYRPTYKIRADYWSSAHHEFSGEGRVVTGERCLAEVWPLTPESISAFAVGWSVIRHRRGIFRCRTGRDRSDLQSDSHDG